MSDSELSALTTLGFDELARATGGIGQVQRAVSGRVFRVVGPARSSCGRSTRASPAGSTAASARERARSEWSPERPPRGARGG